MTKQRTAPVPFLEGVTVDELPDVIAYWRKAGVLPPQLVTGHRLIDREHRFLIDAIANLQRVCKSVTDFKDCSSCGHQQQARCENNLVALLGDVFAFILDHFRNEEEIIRNSMLLVIDRAVCEAHIEDHAEIAAKVQQIVSELDTRHVVSRIRELDTLLARWVTNHIALHDMLLLRWVTRYEPQFEAPDR
ncbi:bacteriohemerythrin [Dechloromonas sp. CZR5]|uniref:bacteriohemerythrin n=1 Tax=Dechloromonas sp. CZR5 TaxID=2608630 RepID=UPI00168B1D45|nr:hemerythrin domain-containing protein [Dechloromonas sp. CZR5]